MTAMSTTKSNNRSVLKEIKDSSPKKAYFLKNG